MKKGTSHWYARREHLEKLIEQGLGNPEIEQRLGLTPRTLAAGLTLLGIPVKRESPPPATTPAPADEPIVGVPYIDENGLKVTRYPARYAFGALRQTTIYGGRGK